MIRPFLFVFLLLCTTASATEQSVLIDYYARAVPTYERLAQRLIKDGKVEPWADMGVRSLMDYCYAIAMANVDLPKDQRPSMESIVPILTLVEEMQDKNPVSIRFGNLRWYWRTPEITDTNAVEFITAHALPIWFEARDVLPPEAKQILERILRRAVDGCLNHRVRSDYTNIAIKNWVNLILLGQAFDRPDAVKEGERRMKAFTAVLWDHGVFEYNSPTYYRVDVDCLQLGYRYIKNPESKETVKLRLDYFWTDMSLHWYKPGLRHAGPQSRTYNYMFGINGSERLLAFAGLASKLRNPNAADVLNSLHAKYQPPQKILALNDQYPRLVEIQWGQASPQWARTYFLPDIVLGTAGAEYSSRQTMVSTVDLADYDAMPDVYPPQLLARNYFIPDGREDPYGTKRYPTSNAGHNKALHLNANWMGAQRTVDALGISLHTARTLGNVMVERDLITNVQSHYVFRKPDAILVDGKPVELKKDEPVVVAGKPVVFRYGSRCFGIRVLWARDKDGKTPNAYLLDDGNMHGVQRLTIDHWGPHDMPNRPPVSYDVLKASTGAAFWVRIGSQLNTEPKFHAWCRAFAAAKVEQLDVQGDNIAIRVAGTDGEVSVAVVPLQGVGNFDVKSNPPRPTGVLMLDGKDVGGPILAAIPNIAAHIKGLTELKPVAVKPDGVYWEAEDGFGEPAMLGSDAGAVGGRAVQIDSDFLWKLNVTKSGDYYLWARVLALDSEHDSFMIEWGRERENGSLDSLASGAWHLGNGPQWRWVPVKFDNRDPIIPMQMDPGTWRLTLRPREYEGKVDRFFLTTDPNKKPE
jgi:hypothetical protein